jgi:NAD(P)-dependent dehydrogenase (short-subunit alcohol dehydrogenase family)
MMAKALAANGAAKVYILGRRKEVLDAAANESGFTDIIVPIVADVTSKDSLKAAVDQIISELGFINVLVANAGIAGPRHAFTSETSLDDFQAQLWTSSFSDVLGVLATNTAGVWYTAVAFLGLLDAGNKKGNVAQTSQIISIGSVGGFNRKAPGNFAYAQSKAAVTHLTKQLATVLVPYSIRSNMIAPGRKYPLNGYKWTPGESLCLLSLQLYGRFNEFYSLSFR